MSRIPAPKSIEKMVMNFWSARTWLRNQTTRFAPLKSMWAVGLK